MAATIQSSYNFHVDEVACNHAGPLSPFGMDVEFPLPVEQIWYRHPRREDLPNLAGRR
jgi:hypothetical protein